MYWANRASNWMKKISNLIKLDGFFSKFEQYLQKLFTKNLLTAR